MVLKYSKLSTPPVLRESTHTNTLYAFYTILCFIRHRRRHDFMTLDLWMINEHKRQCSQHWKVRFRATIFYANELDWTQFTSAPIFILEKGYQLVPIINQTYIVVKSRAHTNWGDQWDWHYHQFNLLLNGILYAQWFDLSFLRKNILKVKKRQIFKCL